MGICPLVKCQRAKLPTIKVFMSAPPKAILVGDEKTTLVQSYATTSSAPLGVSLQIMSGV